MAPVETRAMRRSGSGTVADGAPWRLILDGAADGAQNMAVDEALLDSCAASAPSITPTIRLYGWSPACLSLGKSQPVPPRCDPDELRRRGVGLVRRPTGGLAVLHDNEWTYAVVARRDGPPFGGSVLETYHAIAGMLLVALGSLGVDAREADPSCARAESPRRAAEAACFGRTSAHEITVAGRKLVGSAQARRGEAFLQHGSILVQADPERTANAVGSPETGGHAVDLVEALGRRPGRAEFVDTLTAAVAARFDGELVRGRLGRDEAGRAALLRAWKYSSTEWTLHGRLGERERHWGFPSPGPAI